MTTGEIERSERRLQGIPVSPGIAIGKLRVVARGFTAPESYEIEESDIPHQKERFRKSLIITSEQIRALYERIYAISGNKEAQIFEAHLLFLEDKMLISQVEKGIDQRKQNAEAVFYMVIQNYLEILRRVPDPYLRDKTADIEDICVRVLHNLEHQVDPDDEDEEEDEEDEEHLLITYDLAPSDTADMDTKKVLGFATEIGSNNSHTAILARSMGIPAVVGIDKVVLISQTLQWAILDGYKGFLILDPSEETLAYYRSLQAEKKKAFHELEKLRDLPTETLDGHKISLAANVEFPHEFGAIRSVGADGIGLFRTEFFLLGGDHIPNEEEQAERYSELVSGCAPHRVIFRTLDSGGDKLSSEDLEQPEPNPFLGWRGIRVSLSRPKMFKEQLKAILRASVHGPTGIMFPLVSGITEVRRAKKLLQECREELQEKGIPYGADLQVGIMVEVPSAAVIADILAKEVDFFSIGSNDLTQYTIAVDRVNHLVAKLFRTSHPAVIRLINQTIQASDTQGIWTGICGEVAADIRLLPLFVGMGAQELSVGVNVVPVIRYAIRALNFEECRDMVKLALQAPDSNTIMHLSKELAMKSYPSLFD